jgi:hypothetical protein
LSPKPAQIPTQAKEDQSQNKTDPRAVCPGICFLPAFGFELLGADQCIHSCRSWERDFSRFSGASNEFDDSPQKPELAILQRRKEPVW